MTQSKYYRQTDKTDTTESYDVLDPDTGEVAGFFVLDLHTGHVTDSSIGPFAAGATMTRTSIAQLVLKGQPL